MADEKPKGRRSSLNLKTSVPLLKFDKEEKGFLEPAGVNKIRCIPAGSLIHPVILIGDGRGGKSYLASRIAGDEDAFVSSDSAEPVTEGIDIVVRNVAPLLEQAGLPANKDVDEYLLILDCEGGNNAMAAIRTLVNVFGIVIGTQVVFVASGMASEAALQSLAASLAACSLIRLDEGSKLPERRLHFVVNKNTLKYKEDDFEKMLVIKDQDKSRAECREAIADQFAERNFHVIPMMGMPNFEESVVKMLSSVLENRKPFTLDSTEVTGPAMAGLLDLIVAEIRKTNEVSFPSMHRYVIFDGFLLPLTEQMAKEYEESLPQVDDWDAGLEKKNQKSKMMKDFNDKVAYIGQKTLIKEAEEKLEKELGLLWDAVARKNDAFGDQVKGDVETETREIAAETNRGPIGGRGLLKKIEVTMKKMKVESRAVIHRKRGGDPELGPWMDTGSMTTRIAESAFERYGTLPIIRGTLHKKSPNILRAMLMKKQERPCVLKDGHFMWWSPEKMQSKGEASGCINFLLNRAKVEKDPSDPLVFVIKPATSAGWTQCESFSGGNIREFHFDAAECTVPIEEWINGIQLHINFAKEAYDQIGEQKIVEQVGSYKPTLAQIDA